MRHTITRETRIIITWDCQWETMTFENSRQLTFFLLVIYLYASSSVRPFLDLTRLCQILPEAPQEQLYILFPWSLDFSQGACSDLSNTGWPTRISCSLITLLDRTSLLRSWASYISLPKDILGTNNFSWTTSVLSLEPVFISHRNPGSEPQRIWPSSSGWGDYEAVVKNGLFILVTTAPQLSLRMKRDIVFLELRDGFVWGFCVAEENSHWLSVQCCFLFSRKIAIWGTASLSQHRQEMI